ncbi:MAG: YigZ family protein [Cytophagaceae bacterium SCN 52-12]|nr:MAG: YigZ family protein [Cytophagaceae bacterium SCN 52-12]
MAVEDSFSTISAPAEALFKDRGSRFLGYAYPVKSDTEARSLWLQLKELHPKAVHWCYAYRLGTDRNRYRASDDGEPSGSAGKPILNVLYSRGLTNVLVVVVRYFGGTLLGVPGLINAYKTATELALDETTVIQGYVTVSYRVSFPYEAMNSVMKVVKEMNLEIQNPVYEMECRLEVEVRKAQAKEFVEKCSRTENAAVAEIS